MGRTVIVTGGTHKDVSAMGTLALNIKDIVPDLADELIIFHDGISRKEQEIINGIFPTQFYKYQFPISFRQRRKNRSLRYFSQMVFCKYECFRLLEEYDRVIWTDYDVVILKNLRELLREDTGLQIVKDHSPLKRMFFQDRIGDRFQEFDLETEGVSTPLFVLTKAIGDYRKYYEWCYQETIKYAEYLYLPEQAVISLLIQKFGLEHSDLSEKKYALHPRDYDGQASIIHAYGRPKFWEGLSNERWEKYYKKWLELGGRKYRQPVKEKIIKFICKFKKHQTY